MKPVTKIFRNAPFSFVGKIRLLSIYFSVFVLFQASGQPVDTIKAGTIARNFFSDRVSRSISPKARGFDTRNIQLKLAQAEDNRANRSGASPVPYYVYNVRDKVNPGKKHGFVIVAADQRVTPVLGYSFSGEFTGKDLPPAFKAWMDNYRNQISEIISNNTQPGAGVAEMWKDLSSTAQLKSSVTLTEVLPLLNTSWSQGCDYNLYCPRDTVGDCDRAIAGCVAVAMAQIMKYWNYPMSNSPIPAYLSNQYGVIPGVDETSYRWTRMSSSLRSTSLTEEKDAISELIYHCGVSVKMDYGPRTSSASTPEKPWTDYFGYSQDMEEVYRSDYSDSEWALVLKKELENKRPVFYVGYSDEGGHAFICDGYQGNNCFHFNWGWGGYMDGYFYADNLTAPKMLFGTSQRAMIGIEPDYTSTSPIIVTSPDGGEKLTAGLNHDITWVSSGNSGIVDIRYSFDNGVNWSTLVTATADDGSYTWTIPEEVSEKCLVMVTDTDNDPSDVSNNVFTITAGVATGISKEENTGGIRIFPVPATDYITVDFGMTEVEESVIEIVSLGGTSFFKETFMAGPESRKVIDVTEMKAGYYILRITNDRKTFVRKVMIR